MIRSMTGFGSATAEVDGLALTVEVRSVNSKFLKVTVRSADELASYEPAVEAAIRGRLQRGTVTVRIACESSLDASTHSINHTALERYIEQIRRAPLVFKGETRLDVGALLSLPGVLVPPARDDGSGARVEAAVLKALAQAMDSLERMRDTEGRAMHAELARQLSAVRQNLGLMAERAPTATREFEQRLMARIQQLLTLAGVSNAEPVDIVREVAAFAERVDINEELARLTAHLDQFGQLIDDRTGKPVGRTLDFVSQELLREANTIGSKSPDAQLARAVVEVKSSIDRMKELVQNIE